MLHPSLSFLLGAILAPQSRDPAAASPSPSPCAGRLQYAHREPRGGYLGPWRMLPWRGRAMPLGVGRRSGSSCVFVFLCCACGWKLVGLCTYFLVLQVLILFFCTYMVQKLLGATYISPLLSKSQNKYTYRRISRGNSIGTTANDNTVLRACKCVKCVTFVTVVHLI